MKPIITGKLITFGSMHPRDRYTSIALIKREYLILNNHHQSAVIIMREVGALCRYLLTYLLRELPRTTEPKNIGPHVDDMDDIIIKYDVRGEQDGVTVLVGDVSVFVTRRDAATIADHIYP